MFTLAGLRCEGLAVQRLDQDLGFRIQGLDLNLMRHGHDSHFDTRVAVISALNGQIEGGTSELGDCPTRPAQMFLFLTKSLKTFLPQKPESLNNPASCTLHPTPYTQQT